LVLSPVGFAVEVGMAEIVTYLNKSPSIDDDVFLAPSATVVGEVSIGARSSVWYGAVLRADLERISIGCQSNLQDHVVVHVTGGRWPVVIGDGVTVGHSAVVHGCVIHDHCLIGIGALVLDGAEIGPDSIVAAGAVVPPGMRVPPGTMVRGVPARVARALDQSDLESIRFSEATYLRLQQEYRQSSS
jgi:carbonic anhydrase/acetyltransferase-like protein (isoleucine patch superfamily)